MSKSYDKWKELGMKLKVVLSIMAILSTLGIQTVATAGIDFIQRLQINDARHDHNIEVLAKEQVESNYKFDKKRLDDLIKEYSEDLSKMRKDYGGKHRLETLPEGDDTLRRLYNDDRVKLENTQRELKKLKEDYKEANKPLKELKQGDE